MKALKNSIIGVVSAALLAVSASAMAVKPSERYDLVEAAVDVNAATGGIFSTLIGLVASDDAVLETLQGNGQFTVFAPTNDAFTNLFNVAAANCIPLDANTVRSVLLYHVVKGRRDSGEVLDTNQFRTLLGAFFQHDSLVITDNAGQTANIFAPDNFADNGVIHGIDTVLLPFPVVNNCP